MFESLTSVNVTRTSRVFFVSADGLCFWYNVNGLFDSLDIRCIPKDWRLFIVISRRSLKSILHQNGNRYPSIPFAHSMHLEKNYTNVKTLLIAIKCDQFNCQVIGHFRMVAFLVGLQGGFTKFPCYLCHWDSRDTTTVIRKYCNMFLSVLRKYFSIFNTKKVTAEKQKLRSFLVIFLENSPTKKAQSFIVTVKHISFI